MRTNWSLAPILVGTFVVLVPLIPAFLLFKFFRSTARVSGPLQGFTVQLGGAFAGYIVVLLILRSLMLPVLKRLVPEDTVALWTIEGRLQLEGQGASQDVRTVELLFQPPAPPQPAPDGRFEVPFVPFLAGRGAVSTKLVVRRDPVFLPVTLHFEADSVSIGETKYALRVDSAGRKITILRTIVLRQVTVPSGSVPNSQLSVPEPVGGPP